MPSAVPPVEQPEALESGPQTKKLTVPEGTPVSDTATLSGTNAATATGKLTYKVYRDKECKELAASAPELLWNLDSHQPKLEEVLNQSPVENALLIHFFRQRTNFVLRKLPDVLPKEKFIV